MLPENINQLKTVDSKIINDARKDEPEAWYLHILNNILKKHKIAIEPNGEAMQQINNIYSFDITILDHLEILRLFEKSLRTQDHFKNEDGSLDTVDLFYASALIGLKVNEDNITASLQRMLPKGHRYSGNIKKLCSLERAFISGLGWALHTQTDTVFQDYTALLQPLDQDMLAEFSASFLLLSLRGAGDCATVHEVLCTLNPELGKKIDMAMASLKTFPLVYCYIDNRPAQEHLEQSILNFLQNKSPSLLNENLRRVIKKNIRHYFENSKRAMSEIELSDLNFYFKTKTIKAILVRNVRFRLSTIKLSLLSSKSHLIFDSLSDELSSGQLDPNWLSQALSVLQSLNANNALSEAIFTVAFSHQWHTLSILNAYAAINCEGWLVLINRIPTLCLQVETLVLVNHASTHFIALIHETLSAHFSQEKPTPPQLKHLNDTATSTLGKQLAAFFTMEYMLEEMQAVESTLNIDSHSLKKSHEAITAYFDAHEHEHHALFYTTALLTTINFNLLKSLYSNILSKPEQMQFKVRLAICLPSSLIQCALEPIVAKASTLLSRLYEEINKNTVALNALHAYFNLCFTVKHHDNYTLASIPLIGSLVRDVIDRAIASGEINLTRTQKESLAWFYSRNKMLKDIAIESPLLLPSITLFSPARNQEQSMEIVKSPGYQPF